MLVRGHLGLHVLGQRSQSFSAFTTVSDARPQRQIVVRERDLGGVREFEGGGLHRRASYA